MSASLAKGSGALSSNLYLGGNHGGTDGSLWDLSIIRFSTGDDPSTGSSLNRLSYADSGSTCDSSERGYDDGRYAPYISHMQYEYLNSKHWLFGATTTNNWVGNRAGYTTLVFLVELDGTTGDCLTTNYSVRELSRSAYHQQSELKAVR